MDDMLIGDIITKHKNVKRMKNYNLLFDALLLIDALELKDDGFKVSSLIEKLIREYYGN